MPRKPIELPPEVARDLIRDTRLYFAPNGRKADQIAARQTVFAQAALQRQAAAHGCERDVRADEGSDVGAYAAL